ncbi:surface polysaccharide O-acyltransferase-like enzyme [Dysgonomonas sp. PFB1-18]|uniref:acyltransferase family protein n=1 Tax=unclassified Dysgonomonas TaxID=2630389 RepID=UPI0024759D21|nr:MULTISPECIES: acyltransferase family protein [unclassified Dysgonomonas]MDH6309359.1 surface polysaccharide O-acyltransferase-like enzyme [Dysgonomonas sp. PF1-14]MDH6339776.1 surface polysaccharide O-acyltransferase-like enzyme [Dysgonomonas sp. PF1-16]MDH6381424.1 surface polysaccharide O-acyltransferase-like enzyme [Dysgonomonas sp. PFB1-18]MDH6398639.1 surface polysaccharide O-acyltransferase-like enzyme [Dysgonomonas sp. PF1-23]
MPISEYLSNKLRLLSFLLIIMVIVIHNYFGILSPHGSWPYIMKTVISKGLCYVANPLFFMISGFFFFRKKEEFNPQGYSTMLRKKVRTLLIPYLLISALVITVYAAFNISQFSNAGEVLWVWLAEPIPFHLWFLRYLMLLCLLSPLVCYLVKNGKFLYIAVLLLAWLLLYHKIDWPLISLTFFSVGAFIAMHDIRIPYYNGNRILLAASTFLWVFFAYVACIVLEEHEFAMSVVRNLSIVCGLVSVWLLYDCFYKYIDWFARSSIITYSFFIYLMHKPLMLYVNKAVMRTMALFTKAEYAVINGQVSYLLTPLITVVICAVTGIFLNRYLTPVYKVVTGGR